MEAIATFNIALIAVIGLGLIAGGITGVKVIKQMLKFHPQALYFGILGLMVGSIFVLRPGFTFDIQGLIAITGLIVFTLMAYLLSSRK